MKVALIHELLTMKGGAEKVLRVLADMFPTAPIYTLLYDEKKLGDWFPKTRVRVSNIQSPATCYLLPATRYNHHLYLSRFPSAVEAWDFSDFDLVISSSSAFAHGIITNGKPKHLCYVHSPARYLWDRTHDVAEHARHGILGPLRKWYLKRLFHRLRIWDAEAADRPDALIAASKEVQRRIELYWRRDSEVIYPPLDDFWFQQTKQHTQKQTTPEIATIHSSPAASQIVEGRRATGGEGEGHVCEAPTSRLRSLGGADEEAQGRVEGHWRAGVLAPPLSPDKGGKNASYFFVVSTLVPYKRIDLAIRACNQLKLPLKVAGRGPDERRLKGLAGPTVEFLGYVPDEELKSLYISATLTIVPGEEDFNLVALESMACGTPVLAYRAGGPLETIVEGKTGAFFSEPTAESLAEALVSFKREQFDSAVCRAQAEKFSRTRFEEQINRAVEALI